MTADLRLATWNVNSLKIRLPQLLDWIAQDPVDVICLQELKLTDDKFPLAAIQEAGYDAVFSGQPTYNGVAILSRRATAGALTDVSMGIPGYEDPQKRVIAATVAGIRVVCVYIPNGQAVDSDKYTYKLGWLTALHGWLQQQLQQHPDLALLGDYNIAPADADVHDPAKWAGQVLCSDAERAHFNGLLSLGLHDSFRKFDQPPKIYSWWDYRELGFRRNAGLRIDHILLTDALNQRCTACVVNKPMRALQQPSDHAPVIATLSA